jgi:hypothetical protein
MVTVETKKLPLPQTRDSGSFFIKTYKLTKKVCVCANIVPNGMALGVAQRIVGLAGIFKVVF